MNIQLAFYVYRFKLFTLPDYIGREGDRGGDFEPAEFWRDRTR